MRQETIVAIINDLWNSTRRKGNHGHADREGLKNHPSGGFHLAGRHHNQV